MGVGGAPALPTTLLVSTEPSACVKTNAPSSSYAADQKAGSGALAK